MKRSTLIFVCHGLALFAAAPALAQVPVTDRAVESQRQERDDTTTTIEETDHNRYTVTANVTCSMYRPSTKDDPNDAMANNPEIAGLVKRIAREEGVDETVFMGLVYQESRLNPCVGSSAGAYGLTQLMPGTAADLGVDRSNIEQNLRGGARYFKTQLNAQNGNVAMALAAYNAGPGNVQKYGGIPPFKETQQYVNNITNRWVPALGGGDLASVPLNYGGGSSGFVGMRDSTLNAMGSTEATSANLGNVTSWLTQLGQQQPGTMVESFDHNSMARNANLELFNQAIGIASTMADLFNSRNAMKLTDLSSTNQTLSFKPKPEKPDETAPVTGECEDENTVWDEETEACIAALEPASKITLQLQPEF